MNATSDQHRLTVVKEFADKLSHAHGYIDHLIEMENGYRREDIAALPQDAAEYAFGCGNPLAFVQVHSGETLVDLGSGAGIDVILAAQRTGSTGRVIGIDMTPAMVEKARANIRSAGIESHAEIRHGLIEALPVDSASADWVISNCVLSLSPEKDKVFAEIFRILKPGGRMVISDIVATDVPRWIRLLAASFSPSVTVVDEQQYLGGIKAAGLEDIRIEGRLLYDKPLLKGLLRQELHTRKTLWQALLTADRLQLASHLLKPFIATAAGKLAGRVSSVRISARKPLNAGHSVTVLM